MIGVGLETSQFSCLQSHKIIKVFVLIFLISLVNSCLNIRKDNLQLSLKHLANRCHQSNDRWSWSPLWWRSHPCLGSVCHPKNTQMISSHFIWLSFEFPILSPVWCLEFLSFSYFLFLIASVILKWLGLVYSLFLASLCRALWRWFCWTGWIQSAYGLVENWRWTTRRFFPVNFS